LPMARWARLKFTPSASLYSMEQREILISLSFNVVQLWAGFYCLGSKIPGHTRNEA
jgi:hypothetical protein